ncbi:MAG: (d)CMP kinase [Gemmatimonadota bacterium]
MNGPARSHVRRPGPVVTVDGPAGSGKSTTARAVARRLGFRHLDSGALYRALTHALLESGRAPSTWPSLSQREVEALGVTVEPVDQGFEIRLEGRTLGPELRTEEVTGHVSALATLPAVRGALLGLQRAAGSAGRLVADGRDMGTVVFPDAAVKVYLVAALEERARRRLLERTEREPTPGEVAAEARIIAERDRRDSERALSPLRRPEDARDLDTTGLTFDEQVERVVAWVRAVDAPPAVE